MYISKYVSVFRYISPHLSLAFINAPQPTLISPAVSHQDSSNASGAAQVSGAGSQGQSGGPEASERRPAGLHAALQPQVEHEGGDGDGGPAARQHHGVHCGERKQRAVWLRSRWIEWFSDPPLWEGKYIMGYLEWTWTRWNMSLKPHCIQRFRKMNLKTVEETKCMKCSYFNINPSSLPAHWKALGALYGS